MFKDILRCSTTSLVVVFLVLLSAVLGLPVDEDVRTETLKEIRKYMNESVEPCDNFYEFACGNWPKYNPFTNLLTIVRDDFEKKVVTLMEIDKSVDTELELKVKYFYQSCLKLLNNPDSYLANLRKFPEEFGKMPAMAGDVWKEEHFDWLQTVAEIQYKYGIPTIVNPSSWDDVHDTSKKCVYITHGPLNTKSIYFDDVYEAQRNNSIIEMAYLMYNALDLPEVVALQTAKDIFAFETSLAQGIPDDKQSLTASDIYSPTTINKLQSTYSPVLNITQLVSKALGSIPSLQYYEDRVYLENLVKVIQNTPKKTVANYIHYKLLSEFFFVKTNISMTDEENCVSEVKKHFASVFENIVYRKYTTTQTQNDLEVLWNNIKLAFKDVLNSPKLNWIHSDARRYAVEKVNAMEMEVPASKLNEDFAGLMELYTVDKEDYLQNLKTLRSLQERRDRDSIYEPVKKTIDTRMQNSFSPIYVPGMNKVTIPVAILQPHYIFSSSLPSAYNFGRLGSILGHELVHGFDDMGRKYDKVGNIRQWWDKESVDAFNERVMCFVDQYEKYEYGGLKLPRRMNQGENIADNGGLRAAYEAYLKWYQESTRTSQELKLETFPGFPYNNKQLFFISFAQAWCADKDLDSKKLQVATDSHTPAELRAAAVLSNLNEFSEEFKCPLGSAMNPIKKCEIY